MSIDFGGPSLAPVRGMSEKALQQRLQAMREAAAPLANYIIRLLKTDDKSVSSYAKHNQNEAANQKKTANERAVPTNPKQKGVIKENV
jgi:hypothetical protein